MPHKYLYKLATKHGISVDEAEKHWDKAKSIAKDEGKDKDWAYITGIMEHMVGEKASYVGDEEADAYDPVLPRGMQPNAKTKKLANHLATSPSYSVQGALARATLRLSEIATMANQAQAKRFLQGIGLQPTSVGQVDDNYISYRIKDPGESKTVNTISQALGVSGTKRAKTYGPPIKQFTRTIQWVWNIPGRGVITYFPPTQKVAFMNRIEDDKGEME